MHIKHFLAASALSLSISVPAMAQGIPVFDAGAIAQAIQQVTAWSKQFQQMNEQFSQLQREFNAANGARQWGNVANAFSSRGYLPANYQQILSEGVGAWNSIYAANRVLDYDAPGNGRWGETAKQLALNRAQADQAYSSASNRFQSIQSLMDRINQAPDAKDIADLMARIEAENVMMTNEANKLQALQMAQAAQQDLLVQRRKEEQIKALDTQSIADW